MSDDDDDDEATEEFAREIRAALALGAMRAADRLVAGGTSRWRATLAKILYGAAVETYRDLCARGIQDAADRLERACARSSLTRADIN